MLKQFRESTASWAYGQALLVFRLSGRSAASAKEAHAAFRRNAHFPRLLEQDDSSLPLPPFYSSGSEEEAEFCLAELGDAYRNTPGAPDWLQDELERGTRKLANDSGKRRRSRKSRSSKKRKE